MTAEKLQEKRLRRALKKAGCRLHRSNKKHGIINLGGYTILDNSTNGIVAGRNFELELSDVQEWLNWYNSHPEE